MRQGAGGPGSATDAGGFDLAHWCALLGAVDSVAGDAANPPA